MASYICFCTQSVVIQCLDGSIWRKPRLRYVVGERRDTLIAFSENCGYSSLILHQNLTSDSFSKVSCDVGFETISINVILCYMKIHTNGFFYPSWFCNISYWSHGKSHSPSQANLWNVDSFHCTLSKDTFVNITADLNRRILRVLWNCQSHSGRYRFSRNSNFCLKACFYHWQQILSIVFFDVTGSLRSLLIKSLPNTQVWITIVFLSFTLLSKNGISWNTISWISKIQLATQSLISFFFFP